MQKNNKNHCQQQKCGLHASFSFMGQNVTFSFKVVIRKYFLYQFTKKPTWCHQQHKTITLMVFAPASPARNSHYYKLYSFVIWFL